jgi:hypothetical protein
MIIGMLIDKIYLDTRMYVLHGNLLVRISIA